MLGNNLTKFIDELAIGLGNDYAIVDWDAQPNPDFDPETGTALDPDVNMWVTVLAHDYANQIVPDDVVTLIEMTATTASMNLHGGYFEEMDEKRKKDGCVTIWSPMLSDYHPMYDVVA